MRIKICGLTQIDQAVAIATTDVSVLGFICVQQSPRYITPETISTISKALPAIDRFGVFANTSIEDIQHTVITGQLSGVQLHGNESPAFCQQVHSALPTVELINAIRIRQSQDLAQINDYIPHIDTLLLDAYHPEQLGGTGQSLDWKTLQTFAPQKPWFLAGGLRPDNIQQALSLLSPDGIDLSSGVENSPGDKNLEKVDQLLKNVQLVMNSQGSTNDLLQQAHNHQP